MKKNEKSPATRRAEKNQSILILSILLSVIMITGIVYYFGSPLIWVPITLLTALMVGLFRNFYVKKWTKGRNWLKLSVFLPAIAGIASALSRIEDCDTLIIILFLLLAFAIIIIKIIFIIINKKAKKRKAKENYARSQSERKEKEEKEEKERMEKNLRAEQIIESITKHSQVITWEDILLVVWAYGPMKISHMEDVTVKIADTSIQELLIVSKIKKYITWNNQLINALIVLEQLTHLSYKDELLEKYILSMKIFLEYIEEYKDFTGYNSLQQVIKNNCKELLYLAGK